MREFTCPAGMHVVRLDPDVAGQKGFCPQCGTEVRWAEPIRVRARGWSRLADWKSVPVWAWVAAGVFVAVLIPAMCIGGFVAVGFIGQALEKPNRYTRIAPDALIDEWAANPAAAAAKYKYDGVEVSGTISEVNSNIHGQTYINIIGETRIVGRYIHVYVIERKAKVGLEKCTVGRRVIIKARATGDAHSTPWLRADEITPAE